MIAFGPVPSRRLGRSLGVNNVPPKTCTYCCVYCQLGRTTRLRIKRGGFYPPEDVIAKARERVEAVRAQGEDIDYVSFVPDGEPTLDVHLGLEIKGLGDLDAKIAVITNGSLTWQEDVQDALSGCDWVSLKVDSAREDIWRRVDRPHGRLKLEQVLGGMEEFAARYKGVLATETMLVEGVNDQEDQLEEVAQILERLDPSLAYIAVPTRPPTEKWVRPPSERIIYMAYRIFSQALPRVELLMDFEGDNFTSVGKLEDDILGIASVHPVREDALDSLLGRYGGGWEEVYRLIKEGRLVELTYQGIKFFMRKLPGR